MSPVSAHMPSGPDWRLDWPAIDADYAWVRAMRGAPHDPVHHREGDVHTHVKLVVEALVGDGEWRGLPERDRLVLFAAALLHDVAKPATAREEVVDGRVRITNRGHSRVGAVMARGILWEQGLDPALREDVCSLIARHQVPFWIYERERGDALRILAGHSLAAGNRMLTILARADARGRVCDDRDMLEYGVEEFARMAEGEGCLDGPYPFAGDRERFLFLSERAAIDPRYPLHDPGDRPELTVMSALPASGKTTWIRRHRPGVAVVSLDAIRERLRMPPDASKGHLLATAQDEAMGYLRAKEPFVWDATGLVRDLRRKILDHGANYGFQVRIVALEAPPRELRRRNAERAHPVPWDAVERMVAKWDHPDLSECEVLEAPALSPDGYAPGLAPGPR